MSPMRWMFPDGIPYMVTVFTDPMSWLWCLVVFALLCVLRGLWLLAIRGRA